jgi:error-prone DNA polymerase
VQHRVDDALSIDRVQQINRALMAIANRLELPLVATNAVQDARRQDAQAAAVLEAMRFSRRADDARGPIDTDRSGRELPIVSSGSVMVKAQAYLRTPAEMHRLFAQVPQALAAAVEIRDRLRFRLPLATDQPPQERYGPALFFGLGPALDFDCQRLSEIVTRTLGKRFEAEGRGKPPADVVARAAGEVDDLCRAGLAEFMLTAYDLAQFCEQHAIPLAARGIVSAWDADIADREHWIRPHDADQQRGALRVARAIRVMNTLAIVSTALLPLAYLTRLSSRSAAGA